MGTHNLLFYGFDGAVPIGLVKYNSDIIFSYPALEPLCNLCPLTTS